MILYKKITPYQLIHNLLGGLFAPFNEINYKFLCYFFASSSLVAELWKGIFPTYSVVIKKDDRYLLIYSRENTPLKFFISLDSKMWTNLELSTSFFFEDELVHVSIQFVKKWDEAVKQTRTLYLELTSLKKEKNRLLEDPFYQGGYLNLQSFYFLEGKSYWFYLSPGVLTYFKDEVT